MSNHPNRSRREHASRFDINPTPEMLRAARQQLGLTEAEAAAVVYRRAQAWQDWESGTRRMGPGDWTLFRVRTRLLPVEAIMDRAEE